MREELSVLPISDLSRLSSVPCSSRKTGIHLVRTDVIPVKQNQCQQIALKGLTKLYLGSFVGASEMARHPQAENISGG